MHAEAYRRDELAELVGVCDRDPQRLRTAASRLKAAAFADLQEMLAVARPQLVSVCAEGDPSAIIMPALERGCDVLCEGMLAAEAAQAREVAAAAQARGRRLAVNFNLRFTPAARKAKQWLDEGRLGKPLFINNAIWSGPGDSPCSAESVWRLAYHGLDLMLWLCGDVARVQCFAVESSPGTAGRCPDTAAPRGYPGCATSGLEPRYTSTQINLEFAAQVVGNLTASCDMTTRHPLARCEIAGTAARLVIDDIYEEITLYPHAEEEKTVITNSIWGDAGLGSYEDTYQCRLHRLLEQIAAGAGPQEIEGSGAEAVRAQALVEAAVESLRTGDVVIVPPPAP